MPPVAGAIGGLITGAGITAAAIGGAILQAGISFAIGLVVEKAFGRRRRAVARGITTMVREPAFTHGLIYGTRRVSGPMVHVESTGSDNRFLHIVVPLAPHECNAIRKVYFNDDLAWEDGAYQDNWASFSRINVHLGGAGQVADADLIAETNGHWTSSHIGIGICYLYVRLQYDRERFPRGIPNISAVVEGRLLFDPRSSSTAVSNNPALVFRDYLLDTVHGVGAEASDINDLDVQALANLCDEAVALNGGGTQARYTCDAVIDSAAEPEDIIDAIMATCLGGAPYSAGQYRPYGGEYRTPVTPSLTIDDLVGPLAVQTARGRRETYNSVKGIFVSEGDNYVEASYPTVSSSAYEALDGEARSLDADMPFVTDAERAQRIATVVLNKLRQQVIATGVFTMAAVDLVPGDNVPLTIDRYGWTDKIFEVIRTRTVIEPGGVLAIELQLRENAPSVFDWNEADAAGFISGQTTTLPDPTNVPAPSISLSDTLRSVSGSITSSLIVTINAYDNPFLDRFIVEAKRSADSDWTTLGAGPQAIYEMFNVEVGAGYDVRVRAVTNYGFFSNYTTASHTVVGSLGPPEDVTNFRASTVDKALLLSWDAVSDVDLSHYRIKFSPSTSGATFAAAQAIVDQARGTQAFVPSLSGTYFIKAIDNDGVASVTAASLVVTNADISALNVVDTTTEHPSFPGTRTNVELFGGTDLRLTDTGGGVYEASGTYVFDGPDLTDVFTSRLTANIEFSRVDSATLFDTLAGPFDSLTGLFDDLGGGSAPEADDVQVQLEIRTTNDDPAGSPVWGDWQAFYVGDYTARAFQFRLTLSANSTNLTPSVDTLSVTVDMPDRDWSDENRVSGAGTDSVVISPAFKEIPAFSVLGKDLATGDFVEVTNEAAGGVDVTFRNSAGTAISRTYDIIAKGYGSVSP